MRPVFDPSACSPPEIRGRRRRRRPRARRPPGLWEHYLRRATATARCASAPTPRARVSRDRRRGRQAHAQGAIPARSGRMGKKDLEASADPDTTYAATCRTAPGHQGARSSCSMPENLEPAVLYPTLGLLWDAEFDDAELTQPTPRLQPLDRRLLPRLGRAAGADRAAVARRSRGGGSASSSAPSPTAARRLGRAVHPRRARPHGHPDHDPLFATARSSACRSRSIPTYEPKWSRARALRDVPATVAASSVTAADGVRQPSRRCSSSASSPLPAAEARAARIGRGLDRLLARPYGRRSTDPCLGGRVPLGPPSDYFGRQCWISGDPDERRCPR